MDFRSSYLKHLAMKKNKDINLNARVCAAEYYLETISHNTPLNFRLHTDFNFPLFKGENCDTYLIILVVRFLASIILLKIWVTWVILREDLAVTVGETYE